MVDTEARKRTNLNWEDLRTFMACAESGSFRGAANALGVQGSTINRRIERLEKALDMCLFLRLANGVRLTPEGNRLVGYARRFQESEGRLLRDLSTIDTSRRGQVKVATTEGLGAFWLTPQLTGFGRAYPLLIIDLMCSSNFSDVSNLEADLCVQLSKPEHPDVVQRKLGDMHIYLFASPSYLSIYGRPQNQADMLNHRIVDQIGPQIDESAWARYLGVDSLEGIVGLRTTSSTAAYVAIEAGAGIGALPNYARLLGADIEPVDVGVRHHMEIYLSYHPEAIKIPRVRTVADWIISCFDARQYPWFGAEFIHPNLLNNKQKKVKKLLTPEQAIFEK